MALQAASHLMRGGLDLVSPAIAMPQGRMIGGSNFEPEARGYRRIAGYERYDGRPRPSEASYWVLDFDAGTAAITAGQLVTGATSGAAGYAVIDAVVQSGSYGGSNAAGYLVLREVTGTFQDNENLQVSAVTKCVANGTADERGADNDTNDQTWLSAAIEARRSAIAAVTGSGPVRGVFTLNGAMYAIRDNAGATAGVLHKATASGWTAQSLGSYLAFTAGTASFAEGEVVTGGTSGATGTIRRVVISSGLWTGTAAGLITLSGITGNFVNGEAITSASGAATASGTQVANALPAGGRYDFVIHNFYGSAKQPRCYGSNGVGRGFEWDGTYFTPIHTTLSSTLDKPTHITQYAEHLFLFYPTGEVINSEIGEPLQFRTSGGAGSFAFGAQVTNVTKGESTAIVVFGLRRAAYIYGDDSSNFALREISHDAGAEEWTLVTAGVPTYVDQGGIRRLSSTDTFGEWTAGTLTQAVEPLFRMKRDNGIFPTAAMRARAKDQYRLFYDDKSGLTVYLGRRDPEIMPFQLEHEVFSTWEGFLSGERNESLFIGTDDGYIMEMDRGTSFDGESILAWLRIAFNHLGAPSHNKVFHRVVIECDVDGVSELGVVGEFSHGGAYQPAFGEVSLEMRAGGGVWNELLWNDFQWSTQLVGEATAHTPGIGHNASYTIISETGIENPVVIKAMTVFYQPRGIRRS